MVILGFVFSFLSLFAIAVLIRPLFRQNEEVVDEIRIIPPNAFGELTPAIAGLIPHTQKKLDAMRKELISAGHYHSNALSNFLARRNSLLLTIIIVFASLFALEIFPGYENYVLIAGFCLLVFAYGLPRIWLSNKSVSRSREIERNLPDAMDMIAMAIEGGLPLEQSIQRVANELSTSFPSLSKELRIICRQTKSGSLHQAMKGFAERVNLPDVIAWSTLMQQSHQLGGKIVDALLDYSDRIRSTRKFRAENAGNAASIKLLLPVVLCLAPPIFILLIGPAILDFKDFITRERQDNGELFKQASSLVEGEFSTTVSR